jgi:hypothetical protein
VSILEKNISTHVPHLVPNSHWSHDNPNQFLSEIQAAKNESGRVTRKGIMKLLSCEIAVEDCILLQLVITNGNLV